MLSVDSITKGIVIDHIQPKKSMEIYKLLNLENIDCSVAVLKNVRSKKNSRKDIIKIDDVIDVDFEVLGFVDPNITINIIENGQIKEKVELKLPDKIKNVIKCKNPRCITSIEQELEHEFILSDYKNRTYTCVYCEQKIE